MFGFEVQEKYVCVLSSPARTTIFIQTQNKKLFFENVVVLLLKHTKSTNRGLKCWELKYFSMPYSSLHK